ncbi:reticulon family protein isoform X2 [Wolffia australiana]
MSGLGETERDGSRRRGSIWEARRRMDEVKGGIKVFTVEDGREEMNEGGNDAYNLRLRRKQSDGDRRKRKNWSPLEATHPTRSPVNPLKNAQSSNSSKIDEVIAMEVNEIEAEKEGRSFEDKEMDLAGTKPDQICDRPESSKESLEVEKERQPSKTIESEATGINEGFHDAVAEAQYRMQRIVDLVMWREIPRSGFVFGVGSFLLLSASYTRNLNFSLVSALSYFGLVYLAKIFFFNSILRRDLEKEDQRTVFGEEEAIRVIRPLLPFVNELIINLRALFSGDPATTMKLAAVLFFLARCGGAITWWTMAKMAFFGVFTIPKICSSYSAQLARFGKFWLERAKDAWASCQHKKAMAATIFALFWNLSSAVSRLWAVFMLLAAVRLYQQRDANLGCDEGEEEEVALRT